MQRLQSGRYPQLINDDNGVFMEHVLLVYQELIPSAVLCGHAQLQWLAKQNKIEYKNSRVFNVTSELLSWADVFIIVRGALEIDLFLAKLAKKAGKRLVYILDDDLLNVPAHIASAPFYNRRKTQKMIREIMNLCDCFASPSPKLLEKYGGQFKEIAIIEEPALFRGTIAEKKSEKINLCFAGSLDRTKDLEALISDVIRRLINEYGERITVTFFGAKPAIVEECGLRYLDYVKDYTAYTAVMSKQGFDIGLAPMIPTEFSSCKHYNKFIEYASYGIVGVYSDVIPYKRAVRNRENGMLCENNADAWYEAIAALIDDPGLLERMRNQCLKEIETVYAIETVSEHYYESVCRVKSFIDSSTIKSIDLWVFYFKVKQFISRCWNYGVRKIRKWLRRSDYTDDKTK